jgi:phosphoserine phosphatase RsbU/P
VIEPRNRPISRLLLAQEGAEPDAILDTLATATAALGARDLVLYLIDYDHTVLRPHSAATINGDEPDDVTVDGSMPGRAFQAAQVLATQREDGWQVWIPVTERANKMGVLSLTLPGWDEDTEYFCAELGYALAYLLTASSLYTDLPHRLRRVKDMDLAAEMQWSLLPPLSYSSGKTALSGLLEPAYEVGGDCFDYATNDGVLDLAVFDAMGHGLASAALAALLVGAYRHGRRAGYSLADLAESIDAAARTFPGRRTFATAVLAQLHSDSGRLSWMSCGHPQPLIVRRGSTLPAVDVARGVPLGLGDIAPVVGAVAVADLEPGDGVLFYTDGVIEARDPDGEPFGEHRLRDLLEREHHAEGTPGEVTRRLVRSALAHSQTRLRDDATLLYLRWSETPGAS